MDRGRGAVHGGAPGLAQLHRHQGDDLLSGGGSRRQAGSGGAAAHSSGAAPAVETLVFDGRRVQALSRTGDGGAAAATHPPRGGHARRPYDDPAVNAADGEVYARLADMRREVERFGECCVDVQTPFVTVLGVADVALAPRPTPR
jgi:hypothetical protein